uniref:WAS/WASL interacting protein family member 3 n=1 Tax=Leptobrachium leishanense TaxID=445787 RepID=A0A8C5MND4_9ANUR
MDDDLIPGDHVPKGTYNLCRLGGVEVTSLLYNVERDCGDTGSPASKTNSPVSVLGQDFQKSRGAAPVKPKSEGSGGRAALLSDIHSGARLKKVTQINDRSAPQFDDAKKSNNSGSGRAAMAPPTGGLFAGGFPALKPPGQRDAGGAKGPVLLPGVKITTPKPQEQPSTITKPAVNVNRSPDLPRPPPSPIPQSIALRTAPPRPTVLSPATQGPPPAPPPGSKPQLVLPTVPPPPRSRENTPKFGGTSNPPPPPPPPPLSPLQSQNNRFQRPASQSFPSSPPPPPPPPSHPPPAPPSGYSARTEEFPAPPAGETEYVEVLQSGQANKDFRSSVSFPPPPPPDLLDQPFYPPPPPPPPPPQLSQSDRSRMSESLPPPFNSEQGVPQRPPKSPAMKAPPVPPFPGTTGRAQKAPPGLKGIPPPLPPTRSPFTELTSKQQPAPNRAASQSNTSHDDFESKFTFHSVEEFPPPDIFVPCERFYPSKCPTGKFPSLSFESPTPMQKNTPPSLKNNIRLKSSFYST